MWIVSNEKSIWEVSHKQASSNNELSLNFLTYGDHSYAEAVVWRCFIKKVFRLRPATLLKKQYLAQVFSCEFCEISKNAFYYRTPLVAASAYSTFAKFSERTCVYQG